MREHAVGKAQAQLNKAKREHDQMIKAIEQERAVLNECQEAEEARWEKARHKLEVVSDAHASEAKSSTCCR